MDTRPTSSRSFLTTENYDEKLEDYYERVVRSTNVDYCLFWCDTTGELVGGNIMDYWTMNYGALSDLRIKALIRLSNGGLTFDERQALREICNVWKTRTDNEIN